MKYIAPILILLLTSTVSLTANAQNLTAGYGVEGLMIGASMDQILANVGEPEDRRDFDQEKAAYESSGYTVSEELVFFNGFDEVWQYNNQTTEQTKFPVFKVYFKNKKVVYIIFTTYGYEKSSFENYTLKKGVKFFSSTEEVKKGFKKPQNTLLTMEGEFEWQYCTKGISFAMDQNQLRAVHVYAIMTKKQKKQFASK